MITRSGNGNFRTKGKKKKKRKDIKDFRGRAHLWVWDTAGLERYPKTQGYKVSPRAPCFQRWKDRCLTRTWHQTDPGPRPEARRCRALQETHFQTKIRSPDEQKEGNTHFQKCRFSKKRKFISYQLFLRTTARKSVLLEREGNRTPAKGS